MKREPKLEKIVQDIKQRVANFYDLNDYFSPHKALIVQALKLSFLVPEVEVQKFLDSMLSPESLQKNTNDHELCKNMVEIIKAYHNIDDTPQGKQNLERFLADYRPSSILFHGTNSAYLPLIEKEGLVVRSDNSFEDEVKAIDSIYAKQNGEAHHPFYHLAGSKISQQVCLSNSSNAVSYATNAPEWFGLIVGCLGGDFGAHNCFRNRDKAGALAAIKNNISTFSKDEQETVLSYFQKHWDMLGESEPTLLVARVEPNKEYKGIDFDNADDTILYELNTGQMTGNCEVRVNKVPSEDLIHIPLTPPKLKKQTVNNENANDLKID